jgi:hypothetical protein
VKQTCYDIHMNWNLIGWFGAIAVGGAGTALTYLYPEIKTFGYSLLIFSLVAAVATFLGLLQKLIEHVRAFRAFHRFSESGDSL